MHERIHKAEAKSTLAHGFHAALSINHMPGETTPAGCLPLTAVEVRARGNEGA